MTDKEIIFDIINEYVNGVDTYHNNGSMWFIFTDDRKWVIELTKEGTLWYNFYFFQDCFKYLSLDVVENQHYITEWVEDAIQNGVKSTSLWNFDDLDSVEDAIQNGVRNTHIGKLHWLPMVEDAIQNGVKKTYKHPYRTNIMVEETIENGIKLTEDSLLERIFFVEDTIENGIKETNWRKVDNFPEFEERVIDNGTKL